MNMKTVEKKMIKAGLSKATVKCYMGHARGIVEATGGTVSPKKVKTVILKRTKGHTAAYFHQATSAATFAFPELKASIRKIKM